MSEMAIDYDAVIKQARAIAVKALEMQYSAMIYNDREIIESARALARYLRGLEEAGVKIEEHV